MRQIRCTISMSLALALATTGTAAAAAQKDLPRQDVIDTPAIGTEFCVHNLFQSNMVLQRDKPIAIWGWANPGEAITVSFSGDEATARATKERAWKVTLPARPASSTPAKLEIRGSEQTITLDNVLVGDVWVLGGQSNMEFPLDRTDNGSLEIVSANFENIRILTVPAQNGAEAQQGFPRLQEWSSWFGRHYRKGDWDVCSPEIVRELSAIGYVFARRIHMASRIPIGVIDASRGGTTVETWTPEAVLKQIDAPEVKGLLATWDAKVKAFDADKDLAERVRQFEQRVRDKQARGEEIPKDWKVPTEVSPGPALDPNRPGACYNGMIVPIAGVAVKGVIFHQGYNNALGGGSTGATLYYQIFGKMITAWRAAFGDPELPFGIIALCTDGERQTLDNYVERMLDDGVYIREAQYATFLDFYRAGDKNIGFASSYDQRRSWYHPQLKIPVGERISRWALATQYGLQKELRWKPPMCIKTEVLPGKILLHMDRPVAAPDNKAAIEGFAIAGEDRRFQPATAAWLETGKDANNRAQFDRKVLVLTSPHVSEPIHYRYAWARNPMGNLQSADQSDLPFATQRSDEWRMEEVPLGIFDQASITDGMLSRAQRRKLQDVLHQADVERIVNDARALIKKYR